MAIPARGSRAWDRIRRSLEQGSRDFESAVGEPKKSASSRRKTSSRSIVSRNLSNMSGFRPNPRGAPDRLLVEPGVKGRSLAGRGVGSGYVPSRMEGIHIDPNTINDFVEVATSLKEAPERIALAIDNICAMYALVMLSSAQERSRGPVDPAMKNAAAAWKIPVRRITGAYFAGWDIRHVGLQHYQFFNSSREAFYIEFGINHTGITGVQSTGGRVRIRRPIMKLAVMQAISVIRSTNAAAAELTSSIMPSGLHQSPLITGAMRRPGVTGSAAGLVNIDALKSLAGVE